MVYVYAESEGRYPLMVGVFLVCEKRCFLFKSSETFASLEVQMDH